MKKATPVLNFLAGLLVLTTACGTAPSKTEPSSAAPGAPATSVAVAQETVLPQPSASVAQAPESSVPAEDGSVSLEAAKKIALEDAGTAESDVTFFSEKQEIEDGVSVFDIEFFTETEEYEYHIRADNGAVYSKSVEARQSAAGTGTQITEEAAKAAALEHAGLSADAVSFRKVKLDRDDGQPVYELEFTENGTTYEYEIHAETGAVVKFETEKH